MFFRKVNSGKVSNTVIVNLLVLLVGVLELVKASPVIPAEWVGYLLLAVGVVNLVLRIFFTSEAIQK